MTYSEEEITAMKERALNCGLSAPLFFWKAPADELIRICNGVGADWMPEWAVKALTWAYRNYGTAAAIHDCRYFFAWKEGTREESDDEFNTNSLILWKDLFGSFRWLRPKALLERNKIRLAYKALRKFGGKAWEDAKKKAGK